MYLQYLFITVYESPGTPHAAHASRERARAAPAARGGRRPGTGVSGLCPG